MQNYRWTPLALLFAFGFAATGCMSAYGASHRSPSRAPVYSTPRPHVNVRHTNTVEYRRIEHDAARYADLLDRALRLSSRQERDIRRMLVDRTRYLLANTRPANHYRVYPFPRQERTRTSQRWWNGTDNNIERMLSRRQRQGYRNLVRSLGRPGDRGPRYSDRDAYYDRDGDRGRVRGRY